MQTRDPSGERWASVYATELHADVWLKFKFNIGWDRVESWRSFPVIQDTELNFGTIPPKTERVAVLIVPLVTQDSNSGPQKGQISRLTTCTPRRLRTCVIEVLPIAADQLSKYIYTKNHKTRKLHFFVI